MNLKNIILIGTFFVATSCGLKDSWCELSIPEKEMLDSANKIYGSSIIVKRIPCEETYIRVELQDNSINDTIIDNVHKILYSKDTKLGWQTLLVYNPQGMYLFSHSFTGKKYQQSGD